MTINTLDDLFFRTLKDVLFAERKFRKALHRMECAASDPKLKMALSSQHDETERQILRLEDVLESFGKPARGAKCHTIVGLINEADVRMSEIENAGTMDAALIALVQAIRHYEIARYGTLVAWARQLGYPQATDLLKSTLGEVYVADKAMSKLAEKRLNAAA